MLKFLCRSNKGLLMSMVQDDNFPLLSIKRSEKTLIDNEMVQYDVYVEVDGESIKLMELNKFKIKLINSNPLYWWKQGKKDTVNDILEIELKEFMRKSENSREGTQIIDGEIIGNFLIIDYNESNYLKISVLNTNCKNDEYRVLVELVNFLAPYPLVNDQMTREIKIPKISK